MGRRSELEDGASGTAPLLRVIESGRWWRIEGLLVLVSPPSGCAHLRMQV